MTDWTNLSPEEELKLRQWAQEHYRPGDGANPAWHPVVRDECRRMDLGCHLYECDRPGQHDDPHGAGEAWASV